MLFEKALLAIKDHNYEKAASLLTEAVGLKPRFAEAWMIRGNVRLAQAESLDASLHYEKALSIKPDMYDAWNNRGIALSNLSRWQEAEDCLRRSYEIMPCLDPCMNLGNMFATRNMLAEAEQEYRRALGHETQNLDAAINLGITMLGQKRWKDGWRFYEARHENTPYQVRQRRLFPQWRGEPLEGKTILLWPEQGLGDEIAFMRFATSVKRAGAKRVVLEVMPPLMRLARSIEGVDEIELKNDTSPLGIDYACAIMDIPMFLDLEADAIPAPQSYFCTPKNVTRPRLPEGFNVGLCWQSGQRPLQPEARATAANKSIALHRFQPLIEMGINLVSLQKENRIYVNGMVVDNHAEAALAKQWGIIDHMADMADLADTAGLIEGLDLVISVDTAVAHLAGALGKPVWNLVRHSGYWPWLDATRETRWYPSMRIYRQPRTFDWQEPLDRVIADLGDLLARREAA